MYKCPRCGNEDRRYIGYRNGEPYCRRCISFSGKEATYEVDLKGKNPNLFLDYSLSEDQKKVSKDVLRILKDGKNELGKELKVKIVRLRMAFNKYKKSLDEECCKKCDNC